MGREVIMRMVFIVIMAAVFAWGFGGSLAFAQETGPVVIKVAGKAEILERGRRQPAAEGHKLLPGQSIELVGGGEVILSSNDGKITVKVLKDSSVRYDGYAAANERPWGSAPVYRPVASQKENVSQFTASKGKLEVQVTPGQPLRLVSPLIIAAVRGTNFTVTVDMDGSSRVETVEGQVATYGRNGDMRLATAGQSAQITAGDYAAHLEANGVITPPGGTWRDVPAADQERVDDQTLGVIFSPNADLMVAVLANPNAAPTSGLQALAIEDSSVEPGSLFVNGASVDTIGGGDSRVLPTASSLEPQSSLLDEGLPEIIPPSTPTDFLHGHVIGEFDVTPFTGATFFFNKYVFDLDFSNGAITNAGFDIGYEHTTVPFGLTRTEFNSKSGSGSLNLNSLAFSVRFNPADTEYFENVWPSLASVGYLNSGTVMTGSLVGPLNFGASAQGQLDLAYTSTNGVIQSTMPSSIDFVGALREKPLYMVDGHFIVNWPVTTVFDNFYEFTLDANTGRIYDATISLSYDHLLDSAKIELLNGGGLASSGGFSINFPLGYAQTIALPYNGPATGAMSGTFNAAAPAPGSLVTGGQLVVAYGTPPPPILPSGPILINDGVVAKAPTP
jgi:hypothetical protein